MAYEEHNFLVYVKDIKAYADTHRLGHHAVEDEHFRNANSALNAAGIIFETEAYERPWHLQKLFSILKKAGVEPGEAAKHCMKVEAIRYLSGRTELQPLLDPETPTDATLQILRRDLVGDTFLLPDALRAGFSIAPRHYDRLMNEQFGLTIETPGLA